jgi:hypothetical protein
MRLPLAHVLPILIFLLIFVRGSDDEYRLLQDLKERYDPGKHKNGEDAKQNFA